MDQGTSPDRMRTAWSTYEECEHFIANGADIDIGTEIMGEYNMPGHHIGTLWVAAMNFRLHCVDTTLLEREYEGRDIHECVKIKYVILFYAVLYNLHKLTFA